MDNRNINLDFVKGFLVIIMVLYHSITHYTTAGYDGTKYLRFVTGGFIFISGYIVSVFYINKFLLDKKKVWLRLIIRGFKLLTIFTALNVLIILLNIHSIRTTYFDMESLLLDIESIYITGNSPYTVFQILVPISYLLILSPFFLTVYRLKKIIIICTLALLIVYEFLNINAFNIFGLIIGFAGLSTGLLTINHETYRIRHKSMIILLFCICILLMKYFDKSIMSYAIGVMLILKLIYDFAQTIDVTKQITKLIILLGQYSLIAYIAQMCFIQAINHLFFQRRGEIGIGTFVISVIVISLLILSCLLLDSLRHKLKFVDKSYKLFFS